MFARSKVSGRNRVGKTTLMDGYFDTLTGKMASGKEPDEIRRKENGQEIPKVDVVRRVVLDIDGKEHTIQKTTRQKWKKPRGKTEEVFSGNETKIEVDNYSVSNRAFTEWISENITTPDTLLMCSNPVPFLNVLQKIQTKQESSWNDYLVLKSRNLLLKILNTQILQSFWKVIKWKMFFQNLESN